MRDERLGEGTELEEGQSALALFPFLLDPMGVLKRRWPWMLFASLAGLAATAALVWKWEPRYVAETTVLITSQQIPEEFVRSTVREDSIANINAMVGKVLSQANLGRLIEEHDLYPELGAELPLIDLVQRVRKNVEAAPITNYSSRHEQSIVYGISFENRDPRKAADVANALGSLFVETSIARRNEQARRTTDFLRRELEGDERELREHTKKISEFRTRHRGALPNEMRTKLAKLELLSERRRSLHTQIADTENRIAMLSSLPPPEREKTEDERLLEELKRRLAHETAVNTAEHPNVASLRRQVEEQQAVVDAERREQPDTSQENAALIAAARRDLRMFREQLAEAEQQMADLDATVERMPAVEEELKALEEKEKVLRDEYLDSLRKVEEAEQAENLESARQGAQVSVLDPAQPPTSPTRSRARLAFLGVCGSLLLGLGLGVFLELVDPVVLNSDQIERIAEQPVLGSLPRIA